MWCDDCKNQPRRPSGGEVGGGENGGAAFIVVYLLG
jgi:hypothetical protein